MRTFLFKKIAITLLVLTVCVGGSVNAQFDAGNNSGLSGSGTDAGQTSGLTGGGNNAGNNSSLNGGGTSAGQNSALNGGGASIAPRSNLGKPQLSLPGIVLWFVGLLNYVVVLILTASLVVFLYGIFKLSFVDGTNPEAMAKSRKFMLWGIVSLFVMVSVWGLVNILKSTVFGSGPLIGPQFK